MNVQMKDEGRYTQNIHNCSTRSHTSEGGNRTIEIAAKTDHLRNRQNFDLNKSRQKFHHSLKEHHKISNIPKFRCEML